MPRNDPVERLLDTIGDLTAQNVNSVHISAPGDSPIEKLFFTALWAVVEYGGTEIETLLMPPDAATAERLKAGDRTALIVEPQKQIGDWRVDFLVSAYQWRTPTSTDEGWRGLIVECDGHDFHERTKDQAARDRSRDRAAQEAGYAIFRFTGAELWRDPWACGLQVVDWARGMI